MEKPLWVEDVENGTFQGNVIAWVCGNSPLLALPRACSSWLVCVT